MAKYTEPTDPLFEAFRKIEDKLVQEKEEARRAVELEKFKQRQAEEERLRRKQELIAYAGVFMFLGVISYVVYLANEYGLIRKISQLVKSVAVSNEVDCEIAENWSKQVCVDRKKQEIDEKWTNMFLHHKGKEKPFSVVKEKSEK